jgi:prophage tail gpP-like protein
MPVGTDPLERVRVEIDGSAFSGWSTISLNYSVGQAARTASMVVSDYVGAMPFRPGMDAVLKASGDLLLTGYVRDVSPSHDEGGHRVNITLVSRTIDAVEASIDHPTAFIKRKDVAAIAKEFDTSDIGVIAEEDFPVEPARFANTGESLFYHLEPLLRSHSAFLYDTPDGHLRLAMKPRGRHSGALSIGHGGNIISGSATFTEQGRFSPVIVRGQSSKGAGAGALRIEARASDGAVSRKRPKIIIHESEATVAKMKERARRNVLRAAGRATTAQITVAGWRDADGLIFEPHFTIRVIDPRLYLDREMAIQSVTLAQEIEAEGQGTRAVLSLVDPAALNGKSEGKSGGKVAETAVDGSGAPTGSIWDPPDPDPTIGTAQ